MRGFFFKNFRSSASNFTLVVTVFTFVNTSCTSRPTPSAVYNPLATPPHSMTKSEYPFDDNGNYRKDWVKNGSTSRTSSSSLPPEPVVNQYGARTSVSVPVNSGSAIPSTPAPPPQIQLPPPAAAPQATYYTVQGGDTLFGISKRHGISVDVLKSKNGLSGDLIRVGQRLRIR